MSSPHDLISQLASAVSQANDAIWLSEIYIPSQFSLNSEGQHYRHLLVDEVMSASNKLRESVDEAKYREQSSPCAHPIP